MHFTTTGAMGMGKEEDKFSSSLRERVGGAVKKYREKKWLQRLLFCRKGGTKRREE